MDQITLSASMRKEKGKGPARQLRMGGRVPAIMYKAGVETMHLSVDLRSLTDVTRLGKNMLIKLTIEAESGKQEETVMIKELQRDPIYSKPIHVDFIGIDLNKPIIIAIPIELTGTPPGVTLGGVLQHTLRNLSIKCLPTAIPKNITISVDNLNIGDSLHVSDLKLPAGVECVEDMHAAVASVTVPSILEEKRTTAEEGAEGEAVAGAEGAAPAAEGAAKAAGGKAPAAGGKAPAAGKADDKGKEKGKEKSK